MASIREMYALTEEEWAALDIPPFLRRGLDDPAHLRRVAREEAARGRAAPPTPRVEEPSTPTRRQVPRRKFSGA